MRFVVGLTAVTVTVVAAALLGRWIDENYVPRPESVPVVGPFHNPGYRHTAKSALEKFARLPAAAQRALGSNLEENIVGVPEWLTRINRSKVKVLCLGEDHEAPTRRFLARTLFSAVDMDALLLEVTPHELGKITQELRWRRDNVSLLGADIAQIIRTTRRRNPDLKLFAIEETKRQRISRQKSDIRGTRDESIRNNFWRVFQYGRRYVILFGALHCTKKKKWLYGGIYALAPRRVAADMINVRVIAEHADGAVEAFVYFLENIGIRRGDFVVANLSTVNPLIYEWFDLLGVLRENFAALMVFRDRGQFFDG